MRLCVVSTDTYPTFRNWTIETTLHSNTASLVTLITARKRSLEQGNIFIGVCQEFCSQEGCLLPGGVCFWGGCLLLGGSGGDSPNFFWAFFWHFFSFFCIFALFLGIFSPFSTPWSMSGRYASYWNAFLLDNLFLGERPIIDYNSKMFSHKKCTFMNRTKLFIVSGT